MLDVARGALLRTAVRVPLLGAAVCRRESRIALRAACAIVFAFALAVVAPAATLAISPLVLGVPHIASSVRYLVLRQKLPRAWLAILLFFAAIMMALRIAEQTYGAHFARAEVACAALWMACAACFGARSKRTLAIALPLLAVASALAFAFPIAARLSFVHVHNLGAVVIWVVLMQKNRATLPLALLGAALALLLSGAIAPMQTSALGVDIARVGSWLAPTSGATFAVPLVLAHAFTDSVHYAFWLGVIPEETLRHQGTPTFKMTWRALRKDFGDAGIAFVFLASVAFVALAFFGLARARDAYFAIAGFHGYVEGAMLVYLFCARTASATSSAVARASRMPLR